MARLPRLTLADHQHLIIQRGNGEQLIFRDAEDVEVFRATLLEATKKFEVAIHAYVFMSNYFYLLATPQTDKGLGRMMQWIGRYYVPYFNRRHGRSGTLWQGRFKSLIIDSDHYFMLCSRCIELSPVRAGLVTDPARYADSSYLHHIGELVDPLINDHPLYWKLGNTPFQREIAYKELTGQSLTSKEMDEFERATKTSWPLGSSHFKQQLEIKANCRISPLRRGRPRLEIAD